MAERAAYFCVRAGADDVGELARLRTDWTIEQGGAADPAFELSCAPVVGLGRLAPPCLAGPTRRWSHARAGRGHGERGRLRADAQTRAGPTGRWAYVANVWVDPDHRRRGVGRLLMDEAVAWSRAEGMDRIVLNPSAVFDPAVPLAGVPPCRRPPAARPLTTGPWVSPSGWRTRAGAGRGNACPLTWAISVLELRALSVLRQVHLFALAGFFLAAERDRLGEPAVLVDRDGAADDLWPLLLQHVHRLVHEAPEPLGVAEPALHDLHEARRRRNRR